MRSNRRVPASLISTLILGIIVASEASRALRCMMVPHISHKATRFPVVLLRGVNSTMFEAGARGSRHLKQ